MSYFSHIVIFIDSTVHVFIGIYKLTKINHTQITLNFVLRILLQCVNLYSVSYTCN